MRPLSAKLLERPTLLTRIRWAIPTTTTPTSSRTSAPSSSTSSAARSASRSTAPTPRSPTSAPRAAARELFARAGVPHPLGRRAHPQPRRRRSRRSPACAPSGRGSRQVVVKLDAGVSGEGNAIVDLRGLPRPGARDRAARGSASASTRCGCRPPASSLSDYLERLARGGDRRGADRRARAAQPERPARARAPARRGSSPRTTRSSSGAGLHRLPLPGRARLRARDHRRRRGASARCWPRRARSGAPRSTSSSPATRTGGWRAYAIEVNLRNGGTTHPLAALELLSGGAYDPESATFRAAVRLAAPLRRHRPPRVAAAARARPRRAARRSALRAWPRTAAASSSTCSARSTSSAASG